MITQRKRILAIGVAVALILCVPLIAMQFTSQVNWSLFDFVVAAVLLMGTGLTCELIIRKVKNSRQRVFICLAVLAALCLVWAELAVGLFGTPFAGH